MDNRIRQWLDRLPNVTVEINGTFGIEDPSVCAANPCSVCGACSVCMDFHDFTGRGCTEQTCPRIIERAG